MQRRALSMLFLLAALNAPAFAQQPATQSTPAQSSRVTPSQIDQARDERLARDWGLRGDEWGRYRELMEGPLGIHSPNLDPLTALGIEARSDEERRRYAELQVQVEVRIPRHSDTQPTLIRTPVPRSFGQAVGAQRRRGGIVSPGWLASSISASVCALIHPSD
ncbi:hypothetical protein [Shewanella xiamenensis]